MPHTKPRVRTQQNVNGRQNARKMMQAMRGSRNDNNQTVSSQGNWRTSAPSDGLLVMSP